MKPEPAPLARSWLCRERLVNRRSAKWAQIAHWQQLGWARVKPGAAGAMVSPTDAGRAEAAKHG